MVGGKSTDKKNLPMPLAIAKATSGGVFYGKKRMYLALPQPEYVLLLSNTF
jgi:hypothetical protein